MKKGIESLRLMAKQLEYLRAQAAHRKYYEVEASLVAAIFAVERRQRQAKKRKV